VSAVNSLTRAVRSHLRLLFVLLGVLAVSLAACGSSPHAANGANGGATSTTSSTHDSTGDGTSTTTSTANGPTTPTTLTTPTTNPYGQGHVIPPSPTPTTTPREHPTVPVPPYVGDGEQILIEPHGFWPQTMYADLDLPLTWTNETGHPQKVIFDHIPVTSPVIPPHGQFKWQPEFGGSYTYRSASGFNALVILQAPGPPVTTP
jgi:hypothetical protein